MHRISCMQHPMPMKTARVESKIQLEAAGPILGSFPRQQASVASRLLRLKKRILVLGTSQLAVDLCKELSAQRQWGAEVIGFLDADPDRVGERLVNPSILGTYDQLPQIVEAHKVDTIVVCLEDRRAVLPVKPLLEFKAMGLDIIDGHYLYEEASGRLSIDSLRPSALIFSTGFRRRLATVLLKRVFDVSVSAVGLVLLFPLFCLIATAIKADSAGPVFYRQARVGLRGRPYMIWKFRSMRQDAERHGPRWAQADDPRISRVGWWLRKTRLDELPQLVNVLRGEMSLVGPRPERPVFVQDLRVAIPYYDIRHTVRPGITGWAQVKFRYGASQEDSHKKLQYDLYYVKNLSVFLDFRVLIRTIRVIFLGEGAY